MVGGLDFLSGVRIHSCYPFSGGFRSEISSDFVLPTEKGLGYESFSLKTQT